MREGVQDVVFCYLRFPSGVVAHLHLSWLDPHKERRLTVVGARRMATFDDMAVEGKLTVYDKGFDESAHTWGEYIARSGESFSPQIANAEPLRIECEHFIDCIRSGATPRSDGHSGLRVVRCSSACSTRSADQDRRAVVRDVRAVVCDLDQRAIQPGMAQTHEAAEARARRARGFHDRAALVDRGVARLQQLEADLRADLRRGDRAVQAHVPAALGCCARGTVARTATVSSTTGLITTGRPTVTTRSWAFSVRPR